MILLFGAYAGLAAGAVMIFLSHIAPRIGAGNFIRDVYQPIIFGRTFTRREAQLIGVVVHLLLSLIFGVSFALAVQQGWLSGFYPSSFAAWSVVILLLTGVVIMPLEGHGFFGVKHDAWFMVDAFLTNILWGVLYLGLIRLWLPV